MSPLHTAYAILAGVVGIILVSAIAAFLLAQFDRATADDTDDIDWEGGA